MIDKNVRWRIEDDCLLVLDRDRNLHIIEVPGVSEPNVLSGRVPKELAAHLTSLGVWNETSSA